MYFRWRVSDKCHTSGHIDLSSNISMKDKPTITLNTCSCYTRQTRRLGYQLTIYMCLNGILHNVDFLQNTLINICISGNALFEKK